jgi:hypothetical protein
MLGVTVLSLVLGTCNQTTRRLDPHLRFTDARVQSALQYGCRRSATFRGLVTRLEASDLIVYIRLSEQDGPGPDGRTSLIAAAGDRRYVVISLNRCQSFDALIGLLGHELRHAAEIANAPEVVDEATLIAFYERIGTGRRLGAVRQYETPAAVAAGRQVLRELMAGTATDPH